ncbi:MAG: hypothetical protein AABY07_10815 [Nanoarchaeota archaeon]
MRKTRITQRLHDSLAKVRKRYLQKAAASNHIAKVRDEMEDILNRLGTQKVPSKDPKRIVMVGENILPELVNSNGHRLKALKEHGKQSTERLINKLIEEHGDNLFKKDILIGTALLGSAGLGLAAAKKLRKKKK